MQLNAVSAQVWWFAVAAFWVLAASGAQADEPRLATGVKLVQEGDLENGLLELDGAARALVGDPARSQELARAYLYMGVAYLGLGQEALAQAKFRQAIRAHADLKPSPEEFPARVIRAFVAARQAEASGAALQKSARKSRSKGGLILLGLGGAAAAGVAAAAVTKERGNSPPTASIAVLPEGQAIVGVTTMSFSASASDPDGDSLSYSWTFGDGASATGPSVTHLYQASGSRTVTLTVRDGLSAITATSTLTVRSLAGSWRPTSRAFFGVTELRIQQDFNVSPLTALFPGALSRPGDAVITDPRNVILSYTDPYPNVFGNVGTCEFRLTGQANPSLQTITGTLSCGGCPAVRIGTPEGDHGCADDPAQPIVLTRQ